MLCEAAAALGCARPPPGLAPTRWMLAPAALPQRLFKNDRVPHGWMAVSRYEEIEKVRTAAALCLLLLLALMLPCAATVPPLHLCNTCGALLPDCFAPVYRAIIRRSACGSCGPQPHCATLLPPLPQDFKATYQEGEQALRTAILINCGAAEDVRALLNLDERMNVRIIIIDSHRCVAGGGGGAASMRMCLCLTIACLLRHEN